MWCISQLFSIIIWEKSSNSLLIIIMLLLTIYINTDIYPSLTKNHKLTLTPSSTLELHILVSRVSVLLLNIQYIHLASCCNRLGSCDTRMAINLKFTSRLWKLEISGLATWKRFDLRSEYLLYDIHT